MTMTVKEAINKRYSARHLDPTKKIPSEDIDTIIEAGRKAPSGFGTEPWKFIVVDGDLSKLSGACFNQPQVATASHLIAITTYKKELITAHPELFTEKFARSGYPEAQIERTMQMMSGIDQTQYFREQAMIAGAQMALQATELGIGTVLMGGFNPDAVADMLAVDKDKYQVSLLIALGYSTDTAPRERIIRDIEAVVKKVSL